MTKRDPNLILHRLRAKARERIKRCLANTTVDLYQIEMAKRNKKFKPEFKVPMKVTDLKAIRKDIDGGDGKQAAERLRDLNDSLERFEKRMSTGSVKKPRF